MDVQIDRGRLPFQPPATRGHAVANEWWADEGANLGIPDAAMEKVLLALSGLLDRERSIVEAEVRESVAMKLSERTIPARDMVDEVLGRARKREPVVGTLVA